MLAAITNTDIAMLVVIVILIFIAMLCALAETALVRVSRSKASALVEDNRRHAHDLQVLVDHPELWLNSLLLVLLVCQLSQATLTGVIAERLLGTWGIGGELLVDIFIVFVLAEAAPKTWAIQHTERAALGSARPVRLLIAFPPLRLIARGLIGFTNVILPGKGLKKGPYITEEELLALAEAAVEEEVIEEEERELIESIIEFGDTVVREVMVPRPDMITIDHDFRVADAIEVSLLNESIRCRSDRNGSRWPRSSRPLQRKTHQSP